MNAYAAALVIMLGILSPGFKLIPQLPVFRGEDFVLALYFVFLFPFIPRRYPLNRESRRIGKAFVMMAFIAVVSIMLSPLLYDTELIFSDWMILPMLIRYYLIFRLAQSVTDEKGRILCVTAAMLAFLASAAVGILQNFNLFGVNEWLTPYYQYSQDLFGTASGELVSRIGGTHGDSRFYGAILVYGLALVLSILLTYPSLKGKIVAAILMVPIIISIFSTLSRTPVYTSFCIISGAFGIKYRKQIVAAVLGILFVLAIAGILFDQYRDISQSGAEAFQQRVMDRDSESYLSSKSARIRDLMLPFKDALRNPAVFLVGRGPAKSELRTNSNNDYTWFFQRFGIPGLIFYLFLLSWSFRNSFRRYNETANRIDKTIYLTAFLVTLNWAIFNMAESIWKDGQIMTINMFFLGLAHAWVRPPGPNPGERFAPVKFLQEGREELTQRR